MTQQTPAGAASNTVITILVIIAACLFGPAMCWGFVLLFGAIDTAIN